MTEVSKPAKSTPRPWPAAARLRRSLSMQLLALTAAFVLIAEAIVLIPSVSHRTHEWLSARTEAAYLVGLALEAPGVEMVDPQAMSQLFATADILGVTVQSGGANYLIYAPELEGAESWPTRTIDLREQNEFSMTPDAWATIFSSGDYLVRVIGEPAYSRGEAADILVSGATLRRILTIHLRDIFILSILISTLAAALIYWSLDRIIVHPVRRLTLNMAAFHANPDDPANIIAPSLREDEIGDAERSLSALERRLNELLTQRARLAALGAGVSKISHDLRNILASAQMMSDRLAKSDDPRVRKLAPRLIQSLDRAISLSRDTLSYARMEPASLTKTRFALRDLADEVFDDTASLAVIAQNDIPPSLIVYADRTQLYRVLFNLTRNAVEAMTAGETSAGDASADAPPPPSGRITISAREDGPGVVIRLADTGPGIPDAARETLFEPFKGSLKPGGAGLGAAIAHEIVRAHGGALTLASTGPDGACFEIVLPDA